MSIIQVGVVFRGVAARRVKEDRLQQQGVLNVRRSHLWATLAAYGREGQRRIVEHCLDMAQHLVGRVNAADDLELMADAPLNIVAFRFNPGGLSDSKLDQLNQQLGEEMLADGRFLVGTSRIGKRTIFRPAFSNWRTRPEDIDEFVSVVLELGARERA